MSNLVRAFTMQDARNLAEEIRKLRPDLKVENHRDFGFAVDVLDPKRQQVIVACQPERAELNQVSIYRDADFISQVLPP